jgi:adenine-specific DNA-methyltransferase
VKISHSLGVRDLSDPEDRSVPLADVLVQNGDDVVLRIPVTSSDDDAARIVHSWSGDLRGYGLEISTGPVVPFRATSLISSSGKVPQTHAPLLWMQNVTAMHVSWPVAIRAKQQYVLLNPSSMSLLVPDRNYVLLRRFSSKEQMRRLTAAPLLMGQLDTPLIGLENHLNYIHRPGGSLSEEEAYGVAVLLNSVLLDTYFRMQNGNTQVSATELRAMPLPPLSKIVEIGRIARNLSDVRLELLDNLVASILAIDYPQASILEAVRG